jgi:hypothetical protein
MFLSGVVLSFRGTMASASNDKEKMPPEDDHQDPQLKEGHTAAGSRARELIRLKCIYNFLCSMLVYAPFALCFVTLRGIFMHFPELTY